MAERTPAEHAGDAIAAAYCKIPSDVWDARSVHAHAALAAVPADGDRSIAQRLNDGARYRDALARIRGVGCPLFMPCLSVHPDDPDLWCVACIATVALARRETP